MVNTNRFDLGSDTQRVDIMVDLETLGTSFDATVVQIAAVSFDIETGEELDSFVHTADIRKGSDALNVDGNTLYWWIRNHSDLLRDMITRGDAEVSPSSLMFMFYEWLNRQGSFLDRYLWGNGILFDNAIVRHQMEKMGFEYPIKYTNDRDVRTITELAAMKLGMSDYEFRETTKDGAFTPHVAYHDCLQQIKTVSEAFNVLGDRHD